MNNSKHIDLTDDQLETVKLILKQVIPKKTVCVFGSRITGTARKYSDLDLAIISDEPISLSIQAELNEAFSESNLPFKVDVVDWATASESFQKIILNNKIIIQ